MAVEDAFGNVVTGNTSTVLIGVASGPGGIASGSNASAAAVSGVATFSNLVLSTSGSYTFAAIDTGLTGATSGTISISPGTANSDPPSGNNDAVSNDSSLPTASVVLQQGVNNYSGMTNSWINGSAGQTTTNYSTTPTLYVNGTAGSEMDTLIRWDLSSLNPSDTIQSATITLNVEGFAGTQGPVNLYALDEPWNPSTVNFEQASSSLPWEVPGAHGATDAGTTVLGTFDPTSTGEASITLNAAGITALQTWLTTRHRITGSSCDRPPAKCSCPRIWTRRHRSARVFR